MKKSFWFILAAVAGLLLLFKNRGNILNYLRYSFVGIKDLNISGNNPGFVFLLEVENKTMFHYPLYDLNIAGRVVLNSVADLGNVAANIDIDLSPGQSVIIPIPFVFEKNIERVTIIAAAALIDGSGANLVFDGKISLPGSGLSLNLKKQII